MDAALALAVRIGQAADAADHHPALLVEWGRLTVRWWTHSIAGLGPNDFVMAASTDLVSFLLSLEILSIAFAGEGQHQDAGAKMVDFAGWEMPIVYGSPGGTSPPLPLTHRTSTPGIARPAVVAISSGASPAT